jgi:hypothetical protein
VMAKFNFVTATKPRLSWPNMALQQICKNRPAQTINWADSLGQRVFAPRSIG